MLPVQYKYFYNKDKIILNQLLGIQKIKSLHQPTLLLVEQNHCFGITAQAAIKDIRKTYPQCKIIYTADHIDYSYQNVEGTDVVIYGRLTNETRALSKKQCKKKDIYPLSYIFPWESLDEEFTAVEGKQFDYSDVKSIRDTSVIKKKINN